MKCCTLYTGSIYSYLMLFIVVLLFIFEDSITESFTYNLEVVTLYKSSDISDDISWIESLDPKFIFIIYNQIL